MDGLKKCSMVGASQCRAGEVFDGVKLGGSLGTGWIRCRSLFECTIFTRFPSLISIFTGLLMDFMFQFPSHRGSSFLLSEWITTLDLQPRSVVLRSAGRELPFDGELLLPGLFQQSHTSQTVWLEDELGMK